MEVAHGESGMSVTAFLTDSTLCIGCKACEVACKEWNDLPEDGLTWTGLSYDNTGAVGRSTWRHVKFVEGAPEPGFGGNAPDVSSWFFPRTCASIAKSRDASKLARQDLW
jgi:Fe-S-cluster-containing dehydrogenase component